MVDVVGDLGGRYAQFFGFSGGPPLTTEAELSRLSPGRIISSSSRSARGPSHPDLSAKTVVNFDLNLIYSLSLQLIAVAVNTVIIRIRLFGSLQHVCAS